MTKSLIFMLLATAGLAACSEAEKKQTVFALEAGESVVLSFTTEQPKLISFAVPQGSNSRKTARDCPAYSTQGATGFKICGGLKDLSQKGDYVTEVKSQFGGGARFTPTEGKIKVELENLAQQPMEFSVEVNEVKS